MYRWHPTCLCPCPAPCIFPISLCSHGETRSWTAAPDTNASSRRQQLAQRHQFLVLATQKPAFRVSNIRICHHYQHAAINAPELKPCPSSFRQRALPPATYNYESNHGALCGRRDGQPEGCLEDPGPADITPRQGSKVRKVPAASAGRQGARAGPTRRAGCYNHRQWYAVPLITRNAQSQVC
jgi:hypothetical protein